MALNINRDAGKGSTNQRALPLVPQVAPTPELSTPGGEPVAGQIGALAQIVAAAQRGTAASNQFAIPTFGSPGVSQASLPSPIAPQQPGIPAGVPSSLAGLFGDAGAQAAQPTGGLSDYGLAPAPELQGAMGPGAETGAMTMEPEAPMPGQPAPQGAAPITGATTISDLVARGLGVNQAPQAPAMAQPGMPAPRVPQLPPMPQLPTPTGPQMLPQYAGADSRANFAPGGTPQLMPEAQARVDLANAPTFDSWANQLQQMGIASNPAAGTFGTGARQPQLPPMPQLPTPSGIPSGLAAPQAAPQASPYGNPQAPAQSGIQAPAGPQAPGGVQSPAAPYQGQAPAQAQGQPPVSAAPAAGQAPAPAVDPIVADLQRQVAELRARIPAAPAAPAAQAPATPQADPGRRYDPSPVPEQTPEEAPAEAPQEAPEEAPQEAPEYEPAMKGSPLQNAEKVAPAIKGGQLNIGGPNLKNASKRVPIATLSRIGLNEAILAQFVEHSQVGTLNWYKDTVKNDGDAASLLYEFFRNQPQENMLMLLLDKNNKPISVLRHAIGGMGAVGFHPNILAGVAASTPGCRKVYIAHSHPSGTMKFSAADMTAAVSVAKLIAGVGIEFKGQIVVGDQENNPIASGRGENATGPRYIFHPGGQDVDVFMQTYKDTESNSLPITLAIDQPMGNYSQADKNGAGAGVRLVERVFTIRGNSLFPKIANGADAVKAIVPLLARKSGIAFLDNANRLMGVLPVSIDEMLMLTSQKKGRGALEIRKTNETISPIDDPSLDPTGPDVEADNSPLAKILAVQERSNAARIMISIGDADIADVRTANAVNNVEVAAMMYKLDLLDVVSNTQNVRQKLKTPNSRATGTPKLPTGERLGIREEGEAYDPAPLENEDEQDARDEAALNAISGNQATRGDIGTDPAEGIEGIVRGGLQGNPSLESISKIIPNNAVGEDGGIEVDLADWWASASADEKSMLKEIINDQEQMADYQDKVTSMEQAFSEGRLTDRIAQEYTSMAFTLALRDWLKTGGDKIGVNETNPEDEQDARDEAAFNAISGNQATRGDIGTTPATGLENATPAEPIIKKTRKPRAKPAAPNPSAFPAKLDSTLPFGRLTGDQMAQFGLSDAMLDQFVEHSTTGHVMSGVEFVKSAEDAAHVVAGLRKRPQEQVILLITDKNGRPIQIAEHMLSQPQACGFNPGILIGTAASTPGAAKVWFIHNHPSGKPTLSPADISAGGNIQKLTEAANLKFEGTMAIAGTRFAQLTPSGRIEGNLAIKAAPRKFKVPITERMFAFRVSQNAKQINDPAIAMAEAERIFGQTQPGIMLLDNSNRLVATIPLAADVLQAMKAKIPGTNQTGFNRYVAGIDRSNPVNAMIYTADVDAGVARKIIQNISGMAGATKINVLDAFGVGGISRSSDIRTYGSDFNESAAEYDPEGGQPQGEPQTLRDVVDQAAKKKNELEVGEGEPDADSMAEAIKAEPIPSAADMAKLTGRLVPNHDDGLLASQGFITNRASQDMARIMESINKRFPDGYPVNGWDDNGNYDQVKRKIANLRLRYESDADPIGNYEAQDFVYIDAVFEDGTTHMIASLDLMRGYGSTPDFPTLVTKVGMSNVNGDLQKLGLGSILYVEGGERLRRMGQRFITGSIINPAAVATRVRAFPAGSTELLAVPGSSSMTQKEMADAALGIIKGGQAAYTQTTLDPDVALEPPMPYDDGENTRIPGSERDERLKRLEKKAREVEQHGYMHVGHGWYSGSKDEKPAAWKKKAKLWTLSSDGRIVFSKTVDRLEVAYLNAKKRELADVQSKARAEEPGYERNNYERRAYQLTKKIDELEGEMKSNSSPITHMRRTSGFSETEYPGRNPQGRVEITDDGVLVTIISFRGKMESVADERMVMQDLREAVAKDLGVSPDKVRVIDMDGGTVETDTPEDGSAREPAMPYDDGENTRIPGSRRDEHLKAREKLEKLAAEAENDGYMKIGHGYLGAEDRATQHNMPGEAIRTRMNAAWKKDARMWIMPEDGSVKFSQTIDRLEVRYLAELKRDLVFAKDELSKQPTDRWLINQVKFIEGQIANAKNKLTESTSDITHSSGFFKGLGFTRSTPQGRVEVTKYGVLVSVTRLGNGASESYYRAAKAKLIDSVAKELKVSPDTIRVVDVDGYTGNADSDAFTPEDGSAREPAAPYDDGENQAIPGGGRQAWLKKQAELRAKNELPGAKRIQWWTDVGHKHGKKNREKVWLWAYDKQGKLQVINAEELRTKLIDDNDSLGGQPTHLDWEEMYMPGLLAGAAHGRIDATEDVVRVSLAGRINDPTFREQVKQELAEYIGVEVDRVKGYDFTGEGMPELFNKNEAANPDEIKQLAQDLKGMDLDEAKAYFKENPDKVLLMSQPGLPPHLEKLIKAMREIGYNDAKAYLEAHPLGKLLIANGRIVLVRDASEIPGLSPLEAAGGGFNALVLGNDREATYFVGDGISQEELDALIKHEVGVHMGIGKDTDLVNDLFAELRTLVETGEAGDMDRIMAHQAMSDAFAVVASHYGMRSDPSHRLQLGDRILNKISQGLLSSRSRYTDERITKILKNEGLTDEQIDNFMRVWREETLGYLMNVMARREANVNAPKDGLLKTIIQYIKAAIIRMAYANSDGGNRVLAGATMGAIRVSSKVAGMLGMKQLSKLLAITPGDVRAIAQGYVQAYASGKEVGMPDTRTGTVESDSQEEAKDAQEARAQGRASDPVTDAATYSNESMPLFSKRLPGQDPIKPEDQAGAKESVARHQGKKTGLLRSDSTSDRTDPPIPLSALQVETGRQMLWDEQLSPGISKYGEMTEDPGVIPQSQIGVGPTRDSSLLVADESGNPVELPRITSIQGLASKLGDLAALLDLPVHITQGRQGTGMHGNFGWEKDTKNNKDVGQNSAGFGLEHASWKHGWELDALASATTWERGDHLEAIQKIMADATHALVSTENGQVDAINVYSKTTGMTVVLRVGGRNRKMLHVITVLKSGKPGAEFKVDKATQSFKENGANDVTVIGDTQATPQANEPGADYGQTEQTGEQQAAAEAETLEKLREVQGNGPAGPRLFNAIPPTPHRPRLQLRLQARRRLRLPRRPRPTTWRAG
jgi:DNA repair protein RadC